MSLDTDTKKHYRTLGHSLKPVVTVASKGLTEGVLAELQRALDDHELRPAALGRGRRSHKILRNTKSPRSTGLVVSACECAAKKLACCSTPKRSVPASDTRGP